ncbi:MAG: MFS transporter [Candidatus Bathyarchaeota archaeon]|nr:MFS transporter [Candidatus Bathyarchaeota archaeon]
MDKLSDAVRIRMFSRNAQLYLVVVALQGLSFGMWETIFYLYLNLAEVGFTADFIGNLFSVGTIAAGLIAFPAGLLCERIGMKRAILIGLTWNIASLLQLITLEPSFLLLASIVSGTMTTVYWLASAPLMTENSRPEERTDLFSVVSAINTTTGVLGSLLGGFMPDLLNRLNGIPTGLEVASPAGYRITLALASTIALAAAVPILLVKEDKNIQRQRTSSLLNLRNIKSPCIIAKSAIPAGLIGLGAGFIVPLFSLFFKLKFAGTPEQIGVIFALGNFTLGLSTLAAPSLARKMGKVRAVVFCQLLSMPFIMLIALASNLALTSGAYLARGALMMMVQPTKSAFMMEIVGESERATTNGILFVADNIPRAVGTSVSGKMISGNDFYTPFLLTTIMYFMASSTFFLFFRKVEAAKRGKT